MRLSARFCLESVTVKTPSAGILICRSSHFANPVFPGLKLISSPSSACPRFSPVAVKVNVFLSVSWTSKVPPSPLHLKSMSDAGLSMSMPSLRVNFPVTTALTLSVAEILIPPDSRRASLGAVLKLNSNSLCDLSVSTIFPSRNRQV